MNAKLLARRMAPAALLLAAVLSLAAVSPTGQAADRAVVGLQETLILYADADATTKSWEPDTNFGADTQLQLYYSNIDTPRAAFTLIHFDVSSLPADAVIDSASLELYLWSSAGADPVWIGLYDVYAAWNESTVTWNTRPPGQTGGFVYGQYVDAAPGYKAWSVTGWVTYWRNTPNYGLELRGPITGDRSYYDRNFASKDGRVNLPRLVVTYHLLCWRFCQILGGRRKGSSDPIRDLRAAPRRLLTHHRGRGGALPGFPPPAPQRSADARPSHFPLTS